MAELVLALGRVKPVGTEVLLTKHEQWRDEFERDRFNTWTNGYLRRRDLHRTRRPRR